MSQPSTGPTPPIEPGGDRGSESGAHGSPRQTPAPSERAPSEQAVPVPRASSELNDLSPPPAAAAGNGQGPLATAREPGASGTSQDAPARKPQIGDTRPAPATQAAGDEPGPPVPSRTGADASSEGGVPQGTDSPEGPGDGAGGDVDMNLEEGTAPAGTRRRSRSRRRGRSNRARPPGRYLLCVHVEGQVTQMALLEGRSLVEHYVSRPADDTMEIDGNVYMGRVQNVLPGMEAAFVDIGIPKNAVLYRGDVRYDTDDLEQGTRSQQPRIEEVLRPGQTILCQVTKNPIGAKGARLTQEVSLPGRFAVLVPNSSAFGISKRLGDNERRRLRKIIDEVRPEGHGLIIRTAAEGASADELRRDVEGLLQQWEGIDRDAKRRKSPGLLYREPDLAVRLLREELNSDYRAVIIDDNRLFQQVRDYVAQVSPDLAERVEYHDLDREPLPLFERYHVHEQLHKALDRKVWLPSGGSLIIERTEALTVIDVNTGKNVGSTNLEETVFRNNLEAAEEVARQLRLRDIGGIIVIDFIDMEVADNRAKVAAALRATLARDKTRTQVFDISELGLVEMTRKRVSEGLIESLSSVCPTCGGRGIVFDADVL